MPRKKLIKDKDQIIDLAERLIETEGIEAVSMRRLSKEMGVSDKTLYNYVLNAEAVLRELLIRSFSGLFQQVYEEMTRLVKEGMDPAMAYAKAYAVILYDYAVAHKDICAYLIGPGRERYHRDAELRPLYHPFGDLLLKVRQPEEARLVKTLFRIYEGSVRALIQDHISGINDLDRDSFIWTVDMLLERLFDRAHGT